ncbi:hypothetical protein CTAM01_16571 [Colletotrichum tamarilloi]|uniref:Uncharacterized protein n=1 Tax=Colletotrichum tamarilloi TaxID=1209934 RepID=A0ABQ9QI71_9PEZI|nr:uncharacterized protein CTAM01_16571 [Colletotrichum tamarilloi]KAK1471354.1 hypothetical protein CTAM01_16571 [Colletotrichum tamarilloi]
MERLLTRKMSSSTLSRKQSVSGSASSVTPSDQRLREEKADPLSDPRYKNVLATQRGFMDKPSQDPTELSILQRHYHAILCFVITSSISSVARLYTENGVRFIRDLHLLIVPFTELITT